MKRVAGFILLGLSIGVGAAAYEPVIVDVRYERILIPVSTRGPIPGAYGSLWAIELTGYNAADQHVEVKGDGICGIPEGCGPHLANAHTVFTPDLGYKSFREGDGEFFYVRRPLNRKVHFTLRTRDLSRQAQTWGTELPVVREDQIPEGAVHLVDVPVTPGFRSTVRIYNMGEEILRTAHANVRIFDIKTNALLSENSVVLSTNGAQPTAVPAQAHLFDFGSMLAGFEGRVRLEIHPSGDASRLWAFVSVTNNETQHVTHITPN
jgi:hypothetical protein